MEKRIIISQRMFEFLRELRRAGGALPCKELFKGLFTEGSCFTHSAIRALKRLKLINTNRARAIKNGVSTEINIVEITPEGRKLLQLIEQLKWFE